MIPVDKRSEARKEAGFHTQHDMAAAWNISRMSAVRWQVGADVTCGATIVVDGKSDAVRIPIDLAIRIVGRGSRSVSLALGGVK